MSNNSRIIIPERPKIVEVKPKLAQVGGKPLDYFPPDVDLNVAVIQVSPAGQITGIDANGLNRQLTLLLNRQHALVREVVALRERLSALDGEPIPQVPGVPENGAAKTAPAKDDSEPDDGFGEVAELATRGPSATTSTDPEDGA